MKTEVIDEKKKRKLKYIEDKVLQVTGLDEIRTKSRAHQYVLGRFLFCWFAREYTPYSYATIGAYLNRDHATVLHNIRSCNWEIQYNKHLKAQHEDLKIIMESEFVNSTERLDLKERIKLLEHKLYKLKQQYNESFDPKQKDEANLERVGSSNLQLDTAGI
jgi:chromosomal replication initiation ATPase DnaA